LEIVGTVLRVAWAVSSEGSNDMAMLTRVSIPELGPDENALKMKVQFS